MVVRLSSDVVRDASSIGRDSERLAAAAKAQWEVWQAERKQSAVLP